MNIGLIFPENRVRYVIQLSFFNFFHIFRSNFNIIFQLDTKEGTVSFVLIAYAVHELLQKTGVGGNIYSPSAARVKGHIKNYKFELTVLLCR